jgi:hypothetical protein
MADLIECLILRLILCLEAWQLVLSSILKAKAPQATTSSTIAVEVSQVKGDIISD